LAPRIATCDDTGGCRTPVTNRTKSDSLVDPLEVSWTIARHRYGLPHSSFPAGTVQELLPPLNQPDSTSMYGSSSH
jgi:hypothetical protein